MRFSILNWNIGGAKFLEQKTEPERTVTRAALNDSLRAIIKMNHYPDIITLQEIVRYKRPTDAETQDLLDKIEGYWYFPFTLIDTRSVSARAKWLKVRNNSDWDTGTSFAQGNAFLVREHSPIFPVWDLSKLGRPSPANEENSCVEHVHLDSGLYFGDRNTEPRAALVMHLLCDPELKGDAQRPVDVFVVNLHLTTLMKEREGVPEIDTAATRVRLAQLEIVFNGIISRYTSWRRDGFPDRQKPRLPKEDEDFKRYPPVWLLAGDFNFAEESDEYQYIKRRNFIDTIPAAGKRTPFGRGTKASGVGQPPTLTLDYVFAGPNFVSLDPVIQECGLQGNRVLHDRACRASDHYPIWSCIEFEPKMDKTEF